jgi:hypothetical protein
VGSSLLNLQNSEARRLMVSTATGPEGPSSPGGSPGSEPRGAVSSSAGRAERVPEREAPGVGPRRTAEERGEH